MRDIFKIFAIKKKTIKPFTIFTLHYKLSNIFFESRLYIFSYAGISLRVMKNSFCIRWMFYKELYSNRNYIIEYDVINYLTGTAVIRWHVWS